MIIRGAPWHESLPQSHRTAVHASSLGKHKHTFWEHRNIFDKPEDYMTHDDDMDWLWNLGASTS